MIAQLKETFFYIFGLAIASLLWKLSLDFVADKPVPDAVFSSSIIDLKEKILTKNKNHKKIVVIGGSNVAFGIDTIQMEKGLSLKAINFGCIAGIGPEILLSKVKKHVSDGDIILFCWEYSLYRFNRSSSNFTYLNLVFGPSVEQRNNFSIIDETRLYLSYPTSNLRTSVAVAYNPFANPNIFRCSWTFDALGNIRSNQENIVTKKELVSSPLSSLITSLTITDDVKEILTEFVESSKDKNIKILSTWPNTFENSKYKNNRYVKENIDKIKNFWQSLDVTIVGSPEDAMFSAEYFHDTYYHLNTEGVEIRTKKLIQNLNLERVSIYE
jgi:hypothetical protein